MSTFEKGTEAETPPLVPEIKPEPEPKVEDRLGSRLANQWDEFDHLAHMLTYCRPHGSKTEAKFINKYIRPVGIKFDKYGNIYKQIGDAPTVLWSSHTDTVHNAAGIQKLEYWVDKQGDTILGVAAKEKSKSSCLGADDTSGVWMMLEMIKAKIPGLYIFHRAEEIGGKGSQWVVDNNPKVLEGIKYAIAFDRRDTGSIITHQRSKMCCSDEFAKALADQLGMGHKGDDTGAFTDTANYVDHIPECTNISVGYDGAHGSGETQNVDYLFKLRDAVLKLDMSKLPIVRIRGENTWKSYKYDGGSYHYYGNGYADSWDKEYLVGEAKKDETKTNAHGEEGFTYGQLNQRFGHFDTWKNLFQWDSSIMAWVRRFSEKRDSGVTKVGSKALTKYSKHTYSRVTYAQMVRMIRANPEVIADWYEQHGYGSQEIRDFVKENYGYID